MSNMTNLAQPLVSRILLLSRCLARFCDYLSDVPFYVLGRNRKSAESTLAIRTGGSSTWSWNGNGNGNSHSPKERKQDKFDETSSSPMPQPVVSMLKVDVGHCRFSGSLVENGKECPITCDGVMKKEEGEAGESMSFSWSLKSCIFTLYFFKFATQSYPGRADV